MHDIAITTTTPEAMSRLRVEDDDMRADPIAKSRHRVEAIHA
jgi:hypothetical protein